jgi:drug/metabolite transporter (DMT)-like permease
MSAWRSPLLYPILAAALVLCWSSGFVGIRFTTDSATVAQVLFWRSFVSGLGLLPLALLFGPTISLRAILQQGLYALLGMFFYLGGFAVAIGKGVPTGLVALMADLVPLGIAALSAPMLGQPLTGRQWIGTAISLAGVLMVSADALGIGQAPAYAYVLPILGMLSFALATVLQERRRAVELAIHQRLALQCLWAAVLFAPFAFVSGGIMLPLTGDFAFGILWLVLAATYGAWLIYYLCLRLFPPVMVSAAIYLSPPVTMLWAWALFGEPLTVMMGVGVVVTLVGVWLVTRHGEAP